MSDRYQTFMQKHLFSGQEEYTEKRDVMVDTSNSNNLQRDSSSTQTPYTQEQLMEANQMLQSFYENVSGDNRVLFDNYAKEKLRANTELAVKLSMNPIYKFGKVNRSCERFKYKVAGKIPTSSMISHIVELYKNMTMDNSEAFIMYEGELGKVPRNIEIVKFVKSLLLCQISKSENFSKIVSRFAVSLLDSLKTTVEWPVSCNFNDDFEKVIVSELNEVYKNLLDANGIEYHEVVDSKKKRRTSNSKEIQAGDVEVVTGSALDAMYANAKYAEVIDAEVREVN